MEKKDVITNLMLSSDEAKILLGAFDFAVEEKEIDIDNPDFLELKLIRSKLLCIESMGKEIKELRQMECELLKLNKKMAVEVFGLRASIDK